MTSGTSPANGPEPMTFVELRTALANADPVYDPLHGVMMDSDHVRYDRVTELCQRRSDLFASTLNLGHIEAIPYMEMLTIVNNAANQGTISNSMAVDLCGASAYFCGRRAEDGLSVYMAVQADFIIRKIHVKQASAKARWWEEILRHDGAPEETGIAIPVVAGERLYTDSYGCSEPLLGVNYVHI